MFLNIFLILEKDESSKKDQEEKNANGRYRQVRRLLQRGRKDSERHRAMTRSGYRGRAIPGGGYARGDARKARLAGGRVVETL